jgi:hypothetical protein
MTMMRDDKILVLLKRSILDGKPLGANGSRSQAADSTERRGMP